jgi:hypothetical protein
MSDRWPVPRMQPNNTPAASGAIRRRSVNNLNNVIVQRYFMVTFYFATSRRGWHVSTNWLSALGVCDWHGISCGGGGQSESESATDEDNVEKYTYNYITGITLELDHLVGTLPMELTGICRIILCAATTTIFWNHSWPSPSFSETLPEDQVSIDESS